jgi:peptidoglycan/LPS O-acetylase OafA/YrhL
VTVKSDKEYFSYLHGLRGLAALSVFLAHSFHGYAQLYPDLHTVQILCAFASQAGTYAVEIFFVISGFVITQSALRYDGWTFLKMRLLRIYPVFIFFTVLFFAANKVLNVEPALNDWGILLVNAFFLNYLFGVPTLTPNAWSVVHEMWYYLLGFFVINYAASFRKDGLPAVIFFISNAVALIYLLVFPLTLYFIAGVGLYMAYSRLKNWRHINLPPAFAAAIAVIMVAVAGATNLQLDWDNIFRPAMIVLLFTTIAFVWLVIVESPAFAFLGRRTFQFLGTISYSLYLFHPYPYFALRKLVGQEIYVAMGPVLGGIVFFTAITAITLAGSYLSYLLLEKNIYLRFKRRIAGRRTQQAAHMSEAKPAAPYL